MCVEDLLLYENIEEHLDDSGVQRCLKQETKSANHEGKNDKLDFIKIMSFYLSKAISKS